MAEMLHVAGLDIPFYDQEYLYGNCTVQILRDSKTGETSVGWWENEEETNDD